MATSMGVACAKGYAPEGHGPHGGHHSVSQHIQHGSNHYENDHMRNPHVESHRSNHTAMHSPAGRTAD